MKSFGRYIKEIRIEKSLGLREAARLIGITHARLNSLETGLNTHNSKTKPSLDNILKIAMAYDLPVIELIKLSRIKEYDMLFEQLFILKEDEKDL